MTRAQVRTTVRSNLSDAGITFYDDAALNDAIQEAYWEIASRARCIIKTATVAQVANQPYYDFAALGVTDFLGVTAIFNTETQFWLRDDISLRDFDRLRRDWERWSGSPQFWAPHSLKYQVLAPNLAAVTTQTLSLRYWAIAPTLTLDADTFLIAADMQNLLEFYATADKLEDAEEISKAAPYWEDYEIGLEQYTERCNKLAKADLLQRV